jgi:hypothetical protein
LQAGVDIGDNGRPLGSSTICEDLKGIAMVGRHALILSVVSLCLSILQASAGPCSQQIQSERESAEQRLERVAGAGKTGVESKSATMHRQPTPRSIAKAEEQLGELSAANADAFREAIGRAEKADQNNDPVACQQALSDAQRALDRAQPGSP